MSTVTFPQRVRTAVPGPRSAEAHERRQQFVSNSVPAYMPVYIDRAEGSILTDLDGNEFIDFGCGIGVTSLGHGNTAAVDAMRAQLDRFSHTLFTVTPYGLYVEVARLLTELTPGDFPKKSALSTTVVAPDLRGSAPKDAERQLNALGLRLGANRDSCAALGVAARDIAKVKHGQITCQSPAPKSAVAPGTPIDYVLDGKGK